MHQILDYEGLKKHKWFTINSTVERVIFMINHNIKKGKELLFSLSKLNCIYSFNEFIKGILLGRSIFQELSNTKWAST